MNAKAKKKGSLLLIPSDFGPGSEHTVPEYVRQQVDHLRVFIVENEKTARRFLRRIGFKHDFEEVTLLNIGKHADPMELLRFLDVAEHGEDIGLISEAGAPAVADPGGEMVQLAHEKEVAVRPLVGPSSILLALMASGMNGQSFCFHGYLPIDKKQRAAAIKNLERLSATHHQTQAFIETPFRNHQLVKDILQTCRPETRLCIAANLALPNEFIRTMSIEKWQNKIPDLHKQPVVFLVYAG